MTIYLLFLKKLIRNSWNYPRKKKEILMLIDKKISTHISLNI